MDMDNLPKHIAVIMDGNRRWARARGLEVKQGHKEGAKTIEKIVRHAREIGVKYITAYAFSTENWKRTEDEIGALMKILRSYIEDYSKKADTENTKLVVLGDISRLPNDIQKSINECMERTKNNDGIILNVAVNYGGRAEIVHAFKNIAKDIKDGKIDIDDINEDLVSNNLYTKGQPDPDLLIRTSGELRTSNFLPWQLVYSEFVFVEKNWPDFTEEDLDLAIEEYQRRTRKFGGK